MSGAIVLDDVASLDQLVDGYLIPEIPQSAMENPISVNSVEETAETGDIILWRGGGGIGNSIRLFTRTAFSHASVVIRGTFERDGITYGEEGKVAVFQCNARAMPEIQNGKTVDPGPFLVRLTPLEYIIAHNYKLHPPELGVLIKLNKNGLADIDAMVKQAAADTIHDKFDTGDFFGLSMNEVIRFLLNLPKHDEHRFVCSDLVAHVYQQAGLLPSQPLSLQYTPGSFCEEQSSQSYIYRNHTMGRLPIASPLMVSECGASLDEARLIAAPGLDVAYGDAQLTEDEKDTLKRTLRGMISQELQDMVDDNGDEKIDLSRFASDHTSNEEEVRIIDLFRTMDMNEADETEVSSYSVQFSMRTSDGSSYTMYSKSTKVVRRF